MARLVSLGTLQNGGIWFVKVPNEVPGVTRSCVGSLVDKAYIISTLYTRSTFPELISHSAHERSEGM